MGKLPRTLGAISAVLALIGAWCIGYSVIDKFKGREYGDVTFDGSVSRLPEYDTWAKRNDRRTYWGLIIVTISGVLQIAALYIPIPSQRDDDAGASERRPQ